MSGVPVRSGVFFFLLAVALAGAGTTATVQFLAEARGPVDVEACGAMRCLPPALGVALAGGALVAATAWAGGSPRLLLLHAIAERFAEAVVLGAIAWVALPGEPRIAAAAITGLGASYLAVYLRVRSQGLGFRVNVPALFEAAPLFLVALGLLAGQVEVSLWAVALLSAAVLALEIVELGRQREPR
ncbi:MAG TPA: hypothetical protein VGS09_05330 [Actinomycetota bacterium]|jgi:undecaprenyl pyrophosphate phosphatase UppP|nr:hypothetical protein [Actinomycetota bacterium]